MTLVLDAAPNVGGVHRMAVLVAHPDDEVLWAGGLLLSRPPGSLFIATLCRGTDPDRAPRFWRSLACLHATGAMADLDDGPDQRPLADELVESTLLALLPPGRFDLVLTHGPEGEYTSHRRHREVARAVRRLIDRGALTTDRLWQFAYADQDGATLPQPQPGAELRVPLDAALFARKSALINQVYGFSGDSWESRATPRTEAFHCLLELSDEA
jgi:LmbE family N-acetylglucosaminyl deacetylase